MIPIAAMVDCAHLWRMCDCGVFLQTWFGPGVRSIVEGETRFSKIGNYKEASPEEPIDLKALDLQQLFLAMTEEVQPCDLVVFPSLMRAYLEVTGGGCRACPRPALTAHLCDDITHHTSQSAPTAALAACAACRCASSSSSWRTGCTTCAPWTACRRTSRRRSRTRRSRCAWASHTAASSP